MRTRQRRLTEVGVTTALAAAVCIGGMPGASAAPVTHDWSGVAKCESGGDWHINTGNGYYGGLQFSLSSWQAAGGTDYAARPDLATQEQQEMTAENLLAMQGVGAWPVCGKYLTAAASSPAPAPPADPSAADPSAADPSAADPSAADPAAAADPASPAADPSADPGGSPPPATSADSSPPADTPPDPGAAAPPSDSGSPATDLPANQASGQPADSTGDQSTTGDSSASTSAPQPSSTSSTTPWSQYGTGGWGPTAAGGPRPRWYHDPGHQQRRPGAYRNRHLKRQ
jgi:hypothetical protein